MKRDRLVDLHSRNVNRWNRLGFTLLFVFAVNFLYAVSIHAAEPERFRRQDGFVLYVKNEGTPIYASPSANAPILSRLSKGGVFGPSLIVSPSAIDKYGANSEQWLELKGYPNSYPHGWVRRRDFLSDVEFKKRVERWPIKSYRMDWGEHYLYCRFEPDGHTKITVPSEKKTKWEEAGYITVADGMISSGCGLFLYDENKGIRCPDLLPGSTCFTQEEMDTFLKAKAEGRQPPKIQYNDGFPD